MLTPLSVFYIIQLISLYGFTYAVLKNWDYGWGIFTHISSTLNAIQCIGMVIPAIWYSYSDLTNLMYSGTDQIVLSLYWFSAYLCVDGYFALLQYRDKPTTQGLLGLAHHFVGGYGIYLIASQRMGLGLGIYFAWTELSTPLLNLSWLLYVNRIHNRLSRTVFTLFWAVFTIVRIFTIPVLFNYIWSNGTLISQLNAVNYFMLYGGSLMLVLINLVWFVMLTKKVFRSG